VPFWGLLGYSYVASLPSNANSKTHNGFEKALENLYTTPEGRSKKVIPEEIEQHFTSAGWEIDGGFSGYLVIGYSGDTLSILAHSEALESADEEDFLFEVLDHRRDVAYWIREVPTPAQAAQLLREHGTPPEELGEP
jgi:hypothetical protein